MQRRHEHDRDIIVKLKTIRNAIQTISLKLTGIKPVVKIKTKNIESKKEVKVDVDVEEDGKFW
jgi:hypothetical protein